MRTARWIAEASDADVLAYAHERHATVYDPYDPAATAALARRLARIASHPPITASWGRPVKRDPETRIHALLVDRDRSGHVLSNVQPWVPEDVVARLALQHAITRRGA